MSVNKVILVGNVGRDPEVRYLDGNGAPGAQTKVATFTLATTERFKDRSGEMRENTEWHNIVAWRQSADVAEKYVKKGTQLYIEGKLRTRSFTDATGVKKYTTEIVVDTLQLLGRRPDEQQGGAYQAPAPAYQAAPAPAYQAAPAQPKPAYQAPQPTPAPAAAEPIDMSIAGEGSDDLPF